MLVSNNQLLAASAARRPDAHPEARTHEEVAIVRRRSRLADSTARLSAELWALIRNEDWAFVSRDNGQSV